ncbi:MAG TPA: DUF4286 family protein [Gammaproteobacteria bacterium]
MKALAIFNRPPKPVIYEVRLEIDPGIAGDFDDWLLEHVREMLAFPGFQAANIYRTQEFNEAHRVTRLVVYEVRSNRELESYLRTHAKRMRKEGVMRFKKQFDASRRVLPATEHTLPEGFALLYDGEHISGSLPVCGNCHQPVPGRFCVNCGQEDRTYMLSLRELLGDFVGDLFNYDSRFLRTMKPLLLRPGWVTIEYLRGRRQQYLPPVRMYIFASLIFFFIAAMLANDELAEGVNFDLPDDGSNEAEALSPEQHAAVTRELEQAEKLAGLPAGTLKLPEALSPDIVADADSKSETETAGDESWRNDRGGGVNFSLGGLGTPELEERLERGARAVQDNPEQYVQELIRQIPTVMFFFLPVVALILKVLYFFSGRYYVEHLIFTLHFHSAVFVLLLLRMLYGMLATAWTPLASLSGWLALALWLYIPYYLYRSLRTVYGQGRLMTVLKFFLLVFAYLFAVSFAAAATFAYTLYNQA